MRLRTPALRLAAVAAVLAVAGSASRAAPPAVTGAVSAASDPARTLPSQGTPSPAGACAAPSVRKLHAVDDARDPMAIAACRRDDPWHRLADEAQTEVARCADAGRSVDADRVLEGAVPLDAATVAHVRAVFRAGRAQGRRADAFGLVGDSMTVTPAFLGPFAAASSSAALPPDVRRALALASPHAGAVDVLELFRGAPGDDGRARAADSFVAPRAAKVGMRATWPLAARGPGQACPLDEMVAAVSPAYAVVLYGANDALFRTDSVDLLVHGFDAALSGVVDALEARGIVPILTTVPKHMRERGWPDCGSTATSGSNERFAVQATILSDAVADLACRRHLPLVDLRWALDVLPGHGIGPDGVHLSVGRAGAGVLDGAALQCGVNAQNLVTLRELGRVVDATAW